MTRRGFGTELISVHRALSRLRYWNKVVNGTASKVPRLIMSK